MRPTRTSSALIAVLAALAAIPATAGAGPRAQASASCSSAGRAIGAGGSSRFAEGFEGDNLRRWNKVRGAPKVQSRTRAHGHFALRIPGRRARDYVQHNLSGGAVVSVRLCYRGGSSARTLVRLARNRISVVSGAKGRLDLKVGHRARRLAVGRRAGGWLPLYLKLDARKNRVLVKGRGRRSVAIKAGIRRERRVLVGDSDGRRGRAYYLDDVRVLDPSARGGTKPKAGLSTRLFAPDSFWNKPLGSSTPVDRSSPALVGALADEADAERAKGNGPWIETSSFTTPLYTVPGNQPTVHVALKDPSANWRKSLQSAFDAVPIPPGAISSSGSDGYMTVWQPSTDKLWEFWVARRDGKGNWSASWGGAMRNVSQSPGYYTRGSWPGAGPWWGATATSLPVIGGTMMLDELMQGRIDHALAMTIPNPKSKVFSWPAQRSDGASTSSTAIPEGARFRLDPKLDIDSLQLPRLVKIMAVAAQRYGVVVRDRSGGSIGFAAEDYRPSGTNPWWTSNQEPKVDGYFEGKWPTALFQRFPWRSLQLVQMRTCSAQTWDSCSWQR